jgi:hypothetical protein
MTSETTELAPTDITVTPEEALARLRETWSELCGEIEATKLVVDGLRIEINERDARIELIKQRVAKLREYARAKRDELSADIAVCKSTAGERALMQQSLAHLFKLLDDTVNLTLGIR